jgi:hypothetical protein
LHIIQSHNYFHIVVLCRQLILISAAEHTQRESGCYLIIDVYFLVPGKQPLDQSCNTDIIVEEVHGLFMVHAILDSVLQELENETELLTVDLAIGLTNDLSLKDIEHPVGVVGSQQQKTQVLGGTLLRVVFWVNLAVGLELLVQVDTIQVDGVA